MSSYLYKAKNTAAQTVTGRINASNADEALEAISQQGLVPVSIEEETAQGVLVSHIRERRIKPKELYLFTKQLAGLIKSGVALLRALEVISSQTRSTYFSKLIADIAFGVKTGRTFSSCLGDYPSVFSPMYLSMVRVGEEMGQLRQVLADIADYQKRQDEITSKVQAAMVYPLVMLCVGSVTVVFILSFVMPKITVIFSGAGTELPWPTVLVMGVSSFLKVYWPVIGVGSVALGVALNRWAATASGTIAVGAMQLGIPLVNDFVVKAEMARFTRSLHLLLDSGLPLVRAIEVAAPTMRNPQIKAEMFACAEALNAGESLGVCLQRSTYVPVPFVQILAVAEETGSLNDALRDIAESCETDVNEMVKTVTTLLEPAMILAVGLVVGFIVFAMLLPIFSMDIMAR